MSIEQQVAQILSAVEGVQSQITAVQASLNTGGVAIEPEPTAILSAIAALDAKVSTLLGDVTDPEDAVPVQPAPEVESPSVEPASQPEAAPVASTEPEENQPESNNTQNG